MDGFLRHAPTADDVKEFASRDWPAFARLLAEILPGHVKYAWDKSEADRSHFKMWQAAGVTILPNHFYSPIPDVSGISDAELTARLPMHGIDMRVDAQLALLADLASYKQEYCAFRSRAPNTYGLFYFGGALPPIDAELLYAMVRKLKPARVRELGAGFSTLVIAEAVLRNEAEGHPCDFISIDPYPGDLVSGDLKGRSAHISKKAEHVDQWVFSSLGANDILFIDSTHVVRPGNDVEFAYFHLIPQVGQGCYVHIHDIFLPSPYPPEWVRDRHIFWNEQQLLAAFLAFNSAFEVSLAANYLTTTHRHLMAEAVPGIDATCNPGSFWLRRA